MNPRWTAQAAGRGLRTRAALGVLLGLLGTGPEGAARHHRSPAAVSVPGAAKDGTAAHVRSTDQKAGEAVAALLQQGQAAISAKDYAAARLALTQAYRQLPSPEALYQLGVLASAEGRAVAAHDVMRRYLHDLAGEAESPNQKAAQRIVELDAEASGEVNVLGARGALVFLDDKLAGALPLPLPLLLPLGTHKITVELGTQRVEEQLKILSGQVAQMRVNQRTGVVVVSLPQAIILLPEGSGGAPAQKLVAQALREAAAKDRSAVVTREQAVAQAPATAGCLEKLSCQLDLLTQNEAPYALRVRLSGGPGRGLWQLELQLIDGGVGAVAATATASCADCTAEQAAAAAAAALGPLLQDAAGRARGSIEVTSEPSGAAVYLAGEKVGVTPYRGSRFVGSYELKVQKADHQTYQAPLGVPAGQTVTRKVLLPAGSPEVEPAPAPLVPPPGFRQSRQPRPLWRVLTGVALIAGGGLLVGFGASALSVDGQCDLEAVSTRCDARYSTLVPGSTLVGTGALLLLGGITLVAVPGPRQSVQAAVGSVMPGNGVWAGLRF